MTPNVKLIIAIAAALLLFGLGFGVKTWRVNSFIAGADAREQKRNEQIAVLEADSNKLRGENDALREHVAKLSAEDEGLKAIVENRGGAIAAEAKNLEKISDDLKNNQAVISNPTNACVHCREFSNEMLRSRKISKPLACKDECAGTNQ